MQQFVPIKKYMLCVTDCQLASILIYVVVLKHFNAASIAAINHKYNLECFITASVHYHSLIHRHGYPPPRITRQALKASQLQYIRTDCTLLQKINISAYRDQKYDNGLRIKHKHTHTNSLKSGPHSTHFPGFMYFYKKKSIK